MRHRLAEGGTARGLGSVPTIPRAKRGNNRICLIQLQPDLGQLQVAISRVDFNLGSEADNVRQEDMIVRWIWRWSGSKPDKSNNQDHAE